MKKSKPTIHRISKEELLNILKSLDQGTFVNIYMETKVRMNKKNNPFFDRVKKITKGNILTGVSYETRVKNETENPDFKPEKNRVGEHESKCVLFNERLGRYYLTYEWFEQVRPKSIYMFNGDVIGKELFESYMSSYSPNKYGVNFQSVTVDNIKEITIDHNRYVVV